MLNQTAYEIPYKVVNDAFVEWSITVSWLVVMVLVLTLPSPPSLSFTQSKSYNDPGMGRIIYERSGVSCDVRRYIHQMAF